MSKDSNSEVRRTPSGIRIITAEQHDADIAARKAKQPAFDAGAKIAAKAMQRNYDAGRLAESKRTGIFQRPKDAEEIAERLAEEEEADLRAFLGKYAPITDPTINREIEAIKNKPIDKKNLGDHHKLRVIRRRMSDDANEKWGVDAGGREELSDDDEPVNLLATLPPQLRLNRHLQLQK